MIRAGEDVRKSLEAAGDRILLQDPSGGSRTARQIIENVDQLAGALLRNVPSGAKLGLWYQNSIAAVEAFLAVEWIGGTRVPVDPGSPPAEADRIFAAAGVDAVLADRVHRSGLSQHVLVHDDDQPLCGPSEWPAMEVNPEKSLLLYPRAVHDGLLFSVPLSYENWRATMRANIHLYRSGQYGPWLEPRECFLAAQQIMHGTGLVGTFPFLEMGLPQVLVSGFHPGEILEAVQRFQVTTTVLVPPMLNRLAHASAHHSGMAASLRHVIYGGGPIRPEEIRRAMQNLGPVLVQGYGRLEGAWPIAILGIDDHRTILSGDDELAASCGKPIAEVEIKIRPARDVPGNAGEICVRSPMTSKDYTDPDGWCCLGDVMRLDQRGYLFHQGRLDRMINTGYHVYPAEVEAVIQRVCGVKAVRVLGEPGRGTEIVVAELVLATGALPEDVVARLKHDLPGRIARYKIPDQFRFVDNFS